MNRLIAIALLGLLFAPTLPAQKRFAIRPLTDAEINALILAVEDEIYDRSLQKRFYMLGPEVSRGVTRLPLYVKPAADRHGGAAIYKLMPYGEVIRGFHFTKDGLAVLSGDPDNGFPPTDANTLTLYMNDDDVFRWKHTSTKYYFEILDSPPTSRVKEAGARQKRRLGYSYQEMPPKEQRTSPPK